MDGLAENPREKDYRYCPACRTPLARKQFGRNGYLACTACPFVFWNNPKPVVSTILAREGKVLMIKRAQEPLKGHWCLPGGFVEYAEKPEDAAVREALEETSLAITVTGIVGAYQIDNDPKGINIDIIYAGNLEEGEPKLSKEHSEWRFFSPDSLPQLVAYKHRQAVNDWNKRR